jgi:hypothetical protein
VRLRLHFDDTILDVTARVTPQTPDSTHHH